MIQASHLLADQMEQILSFQILLGKDPFLYSPHANVASMFL
jgi:hypothetical protein